jgi:hypothetical protein
MCLVKGEVFFVCAMKAYGGCGGNLHTFLILALDRSEWSATLQVRDDPLLIV